MIKAIFRLFSEIQLFCFFFRKEEISKKEIGEIQKGLRKIQLFCDCSMVFISPGSFYSFIKIRREFYCLNALIKEVIIALNNFTNNYAARQQLDKEKMICEWMV